MARLGKKPLERKAVGIQLNSQCHMWVIQYITHLSLTPVIITINYDKQRCRGETMELKRKEEKRKDLASAGFKVWHTLYNWNFFMTPGSYAHHYPTLPEIPQGTRKLHVVWFHWNLWSHSDTSQSRNGETEMKCQTESGELTSGCSCHVSTPYRKREKAVVGLQYVFYVLIMMITFYMVAYSMTNTILKKGIMQLLYFTLNQHLQNHFDSTVTCKECN